MRKTLIFPLSYALHINYIIYTHKNGNDDDIDDMRGVFFP